MKTKSQKRRLRRFILGVFDQHEADSILREKEANKLLNQEWDRHSYDYSKVGIPPLPFEQILEPDSLSGDEAHRKVTRLRRWKRWHAAAVLLIFMLGIGIPAWYYIQNSDEFNTYTWSTANGDRQKIVLPDGSNAWLNAGSNLMYTSGPDCRDIFIEGEAYFDVQPSEKPFIVNAGEVTVEVLGTHFNVNAYPDHGEVETTLVEGAVKLSTKKGEDMNLRPGEKATYSVEDRHLEVEIVDTRLYTSWTRGELSFDSQSLEIILSSLQRWYDRPLRMDRSLKDKYRFTLTIRDESLEDVLNLLQMTAPITHELRGDTLVVMPK